MIKQRKSHRNLKTPIILKLHFLKVTRLKPLFKAPIFGASNTKDLCSFRGLSKPPPFMLSSSRALIGSVTAVLLVQDHKFLQFTWPRSMLSILCRTVSEWNAMINNRVTG